MDLQRGRRTNMPRAFRFAVATGLALGVATTASVAAAATAFYPVNKCVATKEREAANYCRRSLNAHAAGHNGQTDTNERLARAGSRLAKRWTKAESLASQKGTDCAATTALSADVKSAIDAAVSEIVDDIDDGLSNQHCGARLLQAAA